MLVRLIGTTHVMSSHVTSIKEIRAATLKAHTCNRYACVSKYIQRPITLLSYLLGELVLDDAHNSAGGLNIDALRLELGKGIHSKGAS